MRRNERTNEGDGGEEGDPEGARKTERVVSGPSCAPLRAALHVSLRTSPFLRRTNQPTALSLQLFAGVQPPRDSERRTQRPRRALTQPPVSRLPKAVALTSWPAVSLVPCRHHPLRARHQPRRRVLPSQPEVHPSRKPLARPTDRRHRPRPTRKTLRENLAPASTTRENCIVAL